MELYPDSHHLRELDLYNVLMVALMVKNLPAMQEPQVRSLGWIRKIPWRKEWQPTPVFLSGESRGQRSLVGYSPWDHKVKHDRSDLACMQAHKDKIVVVVQPPNCVQPFVHMDCSTPSLLVPHSSPEVCPSSCPLHW